MDENITRILKMVEEGKINSEKAAELIDALKSKESSAGETASNPEKMLKVIVLSAGGENVNIKLPIKFVKASLKAFGKIPIQLHGSSDRDIDMQAIADAIENGICGKICEIKSKSGDNVEVVIE